MKVDAVRLEDRLAPAEPPYKSRGEAQVGRLLDRYGIPFFYEYPRIIHDRGRDRTWHPDFSLFNYRGLVLEYAGMPERPEYMDGVLHKQRAYAANGIPAMFLYPQDLQGPNWPGRIIDRIHQSYPAQTSQRFYGGSPRQPRAAYGRSRAGYR